MISIALLLFIVLDPFGNLVTLNTLLRSAAPARRRRIILRESLIALAILQLFVFAGGAILHALGLQAYALGISGGIVLFMIALGMVFPARKVLDKEGLDDPLVVPIAMPLIAGPGAISVVILLAQTNPLLSVAGAVVVAWLPTAVMLTASTWLFNFLGPRGAVALERLMGILLVMVSVQMVLNGLTDYMKAA
ncbi:MAG TPA: MarC family protein [Vicinamibacterales bacterium]|nr:MarC family protein [Vicinamibacterales bacterium]